MRQLIKSILPSRLIIKYHIFRNLKQKAKNEKLFFGTDVFCPICNSSYKIFGTHGLKKRENARCYSCNSLERHRLLYLYLNDKLKFFDNSTKVIRLLHFAPEQMFYDKFSNNNSIDYTPCDLYPNKYMFDGITKIIKVDITKIPFKDGSFDFILCNHVLEHIPDDNLAMKELYRVMTKNGNGIFQVPIDYSRNNTYEDWSITAPKEREKAFGQNDHVRLYGKDYKDRLINAGFIVQEIDYISNFSEDEINKYGLMKSEKIYHVKK